MQGRSGFRGGRRRPAPCRPPAQAAAAQRGPV